MFTQCQPNDPSHQGVKALLYQWDHHLMYLYLFSRLFTYAQRHCVAVLVTVGVVANVTRTDRVGTDDPAIAVVLSPNDAVLVH